MPFTHTIGRTTFHFIWNGDTPVLLKTVYNLEEGDDDWGEEAA